MQAAIQFFKDALRHEVRASAFYNRAAEITRNDESRMLFIKLAGMEEDHTSTLLAKAREAPCGKAFDVDAYVRELGEITTPSLSAEESRVVETGTLREVLELAIQFEHQAIADYDGLAREAVDFDVRAHSQELAADERRHTQELTNLLHSLDMSEEDRPGL